MFFAKCHNESRRVVKQAILSAGIKSEVKREQEIEPRKNGRAGKAGKPVFDRPLLIHLRSYRNIAARGNMKNGC